LEELRVLPSLQANRKNNNRLFMHRRFTVRIWELLKEWLGLQTIHPRLWAGLTIRKWWSSMAEDASLHQKGLASLTLLKKWEIWQEQNARIF
jgi:hypothetical protein